LNKTCYNCSFIIIGLFGISYTYEKLYATNVYYREFCSRREIFDLIDVQTISGEIAIPRSRYWNYQKNATKNGVVKSRICRFTRGIVFGNKDRAENSCFRANVWGIKGQNLGSWKDFTANWRLCFFDIYIS
jgi:hypothetical protein